MLQPILNLIHNQVQTSGPKCLGCNIPGYPHLRIERKGYETVELVGHEDDIRAWRLAHRIARYHGATQEYGVAAAHSGIGNLFHPGRAIYCLIVDEYTGGENEFNQLWPTD